MVFRGLNGRCRCAAVLACVLFVSLLMPAAAQHSAVGPFVWLADHKQLKRIEVPSGGIEFLALLEHEAEALALDPGDGGVWVLAQKSLLKYNAQGQVVAQVDLKRLAEKLGDPTRLALNPYDASLWVSGEKTLLHVSADGQRLDAWELANVVRDIALDQDESLWVITHTELIQISKQGAVLQNHTLIDRIKNAERLSIDGLGGLLWIANKDELFQLELSRPADPVRAVGLPQKTEIVALGIAPFTGNLWVATKSQNILIYDRNAALLKTVNFQAHDLGDVQSLIHEPVTSSFWLGGKKAVARYDSTGSLLARWAVEKDAHALAATVFMLSPRLTLIEPNNGDLTNNPRPAIRLGLGATCTGIPCLMPEAYTQSIVLNALLNGQSVGSSFIRTPTEAAYVPASRLPEGMNILSAQALDLFGHTSNSINATFTIDTVPPKFIVINPADGSSVTSATVTLSGKLDDLTATVSVQDGAGNVVAFGGANFSFSLQLKAGLNNFVLTARDPAGNQTTQTWRVTYGGVSVHITAPHAGASLANGGVVVRGNFQGPSNTGITVNDQVAQVVGNQFYANINLDPGPNTLTAVATTPEGATASDSVSVNLNRTGSDPIQIRVEPQSGVAPLKVRFRVDNFSGQPIQQINADFNGDGINDFSAGDANAVLEHTYATPGVYFASIAVTDSQNIVTTQTVVVVVRDAGQMDDLFTNLWNGMNNALVRGDVAGAAQYLNESAKLKYVPVFETLKPHFADIVASYSPLRRVSISESIGEYAIVRRSNGQNRIYLIYFLQDADGVWRLDGM